MRAVASSSPSVKNTPPDTPVIVATIRPHATLAAGVSVFVRLGGTDQDDPDGASDRPRRTGQRGPSLIRFDLDQDVLRHADPPVTVDLRTTFRYLSALAYRSGNTFAPAAAVDMLARREHSEAELRRKLRARGFSPGAIDLALERVQAREYQSDDRFAASFIRSRMGGSGVSRPALLAGLARRGIDRYTAERAIADYASEHPGCFTRALQAALGPLRDEDETRIIRRLSRRGFDVVEIRKNIGWHY